MKIIQEERYFKGEERLVETVQKLLNPPLRIVKRETVEKPHTAKVYKETMYFIDMKTVRLWFLMNTNYKDTEKNRASQFSSFIIFNILQTKLIQ